MKEIIMNGIIKIIMILTGLLFGVAAFAECFGIQYHMPVVFFFTLNILIILILINESERRFLYFGMTGIGFGLAGIFTFSYIRVGLLNIVNLVLQRYYQYFGTDILYQYEYEKFDNVQLSWYHTFAICAIMVVLVSIMLLFSWHKFYVVPHICFLLFVIGVPAALGKLPSKELMAGLIFYGMCCMMARRAYKISKLGILYTLLLSVTGYLLAVIWMEPENYEKNISLGDIRGRIQKTLYEFDFDKLLKSEAIENLEVQVQLDGSWASGGDNQGKLGAVDRIQFTNEPMLRVVLSNDNNGVYLKGFSANRYTGTNWEISVGETYNQIVKEAGNDVNTYSWKAMSMTSIILHDILKDTDSRTEMSVWKSEKNISSALFYPYGSEILSDLPNLDFYLSENIAATHLERLKDSKGIEHQYLGGRTYRYNPYLLNDLLAMKDMAVEDRIYSLMDDETLEQYTAYKNYVYDTCMQVPESMEKLFQTLIPDAPKYDGETAESFMKCILYVKDYLEKNTSYSLNPGRRKTKDFVREFLTVKKRGYCTSYASTTALMLRYMGIPTRYATGYYIPRTEIAAGAYDTLNSEYIVDVKDSAAHAWTEVFLEPYGFVVVDTTPGSYSDYEEEESNTVVSESGEQTTQNTETTGAQIETTTTQEESSSSTSGIETTETVETTKEMSVLNKEKAQNTWYYLIVFLIVILGIVIVFVIASNKQPFETKEVAEAADAAEQRERKGIVTLGENFFEDLEQNGIIYKDGWLMDTQTITERILNIYGTVITEEETKAFLELYQKAKYSVDSDKFSKKEYEKVVNYVDKCKNSLQSEEK